VSKDLKPFYVILRDDDFRLCRQDTRATAEAEAQRLARKEPEHAFIVLQTVKIVGPIQPKVALREFIPADSDNIPF
jgi:hypothetical protein